MEPCARAAFELPLDETGHVGDAPMRLLAWEDGSKDPHALARLQTRARASSWKLPARPEGSSRPTGSAVAYALLRLDCRSAATGESVTPGPFEGHVQHSLRMRRLATEHLIRETGVSWSEHDLDCLWSHLASWRRGPFFHDALEGWEALEPRLQALQERDGGVWVCRAARSSHRGQFVFLDGEGRVLAVARYWIGE